MVMRGVRRCSRCWLRGSVSGRYRALRTKRRQGAVTMLSAGGGWSSVWDDETHLGRAVAVSLGGGTCAAVICCSPEPSTRQRTLAIPGTAHRRPPRTPALRAQRISSEGTMRVWPVAGVSVGLIHASGTHITQTFVLNNGVIVVRGPDEQRTWHVTRPAYDLHTGARVRLSRSIRADQRHGGVRHGEDRQVARSSCRCSASRRCFTSTSACGEAGATSAGTPAGVLEGDAEAELHSARIGPPWSSGS